MSLGSSSSYAIGWSASRDRTADTSRGGNSLLLPITIWRISRSDPNFSIFERWSRHKETFPTLAKIAKQLLAVPASTVVVEQTFSNGGNILDERRSRLGPKSLEAQTCLDDWERARLQSQKDLIHSSSSDEWVNDGYGTTTAASSSNSSDDDASN
ncbi:uncharacterized protein LOC120257691 [Dioscorea cayenensis subsp. rotundata]|uniref:Uncharacterized protein LOC120257691 n=1 Tax=Dioscorea cayennensis subsp. rotundata TaxID=55577 RepID=A0AB40B1Y8_DIOCR|nr:uncharacterized protein LOC120257691 [Dioscorea cayenensis subsp. rotundata]